MSTEELIPLELFCSHQGVEMAFVHALCERGLLQITVVEDRSFVAPEVLPHIEKLARMHYELEINLEGIEAISHLLERMELLQHEMRSLHARLRLYE